MSVVGTEAAVKYLKSWKTSRKTWTFEKEKQAWINDNKFSKDLIPDAIWPLVIEYLSTGSIHSKKMVIADCKKLISETTSYDQEPAKTSYERANGLIQNLKI